MYFRKEMMGTLTTRSNKSMTQEQSFNLFIFSNLVNIRVSPKTTLQNIMVSITISKLDVCMYLHEHTYTM